MITGIVVALREEAKTLSRSKLRKGEVVKLTDTVYLAYSGAGAENARIAAERLLERGVDNLISWGCAASLMEDLRPGVLVIAQDWVKEDGTITYAGKQLGYSRLQQRYSAQFPVHVGNMVHSNTIVAQAGDKLKIAETSGASALDMESFAVAGCALSNQKAFVTVRVIADTVSMRLPSAVIQSLDIDGETIPLKLAVNILKNPLELVALIKLGLAFSRAKHTLKTIAGDLDNFISLAFAQSSNV